MRIPAERGRSILSDLVATLDTMANAPAPDPAVVARYAHAALDNARALVADAEVLMERERWSRACSLGVLAAEEAGKAYMCGLLPVLPPDQARELFSWTFAEVNRGHEMKLGIAVIIRHLLQTLQQPTSTPQAPGEAALAEGVRADNERKQRGFYVGFRDGKIRQPADLTEQEARETTAQAAAMINLAADFMSWTANLPAELLAGREEIWQAIVTAFEHGGYAGMVDLAQRSVVDLTDADIAAIREGFLSVASGQGRPGIEA